MTALAICVDPKNGIVFASDGVCYEDDGTLIGLGSKIVLMPESNCAMMCRGAGAFGPALRNHIGLGIYSLDDLMEYIVETSKAVLDAYLKHYCISEAPVSVIVGGWSEENSRFEAFRFGSHERRWKNHESGEWKKLDPWTVEPIDGLWAAPWPPTELYEQFSIDPNAITDAYDFTARLVCASRQRKAKLSDRPDAPEGYGVGGFLQMTVLEKDNMRSSIVHRWPDVIGEKIDPTRGEPMPAFLTVPPAS